MNTGAHPDDETTAMLAALGLRDGIDLSYACSTRGEGGQNDIGTEATEALGVLRTAEMERACDVLNMRMYWLSEAPDDSIFDFGFSKSGVETMGKWGRKRTLKRLVDILRTERPDIICPTFLDISGQHGHHRAMTQAALLAMDLCGDPAYVDSNLTPWQVKKLYLPAWSGAGQSYDDDLPPPPETLTINADGTDPVTGHSYERIAQQSRAFHLTQAMGRWVPAGAERNWPLHLADSRVDGPDDTVFAGLPRTLADLPGTGLLEVQDHIDAARIAFPSMECVMHHASLALQALDRASVAPEYAHKLDRKRTQLAHVIRITAGVEVHARLTRDALLQDDETRFDIESRAGLAEQLKTQLTLPDGWSDNAGRVVLKAAKLSDPYPSVYLPDEPNAPSVCVTIVTNGVESCTNLPLEVPPTVSPARAAVLSPKTDVINLQSPRRALTISLSEVSPHGSKPALTLPEGWTCAQSETGITVNLPQDVEPGRYSLPLTLDGHPAETATRIEYAHVDPRVLCTPATVTVLVVDAALPKVRIGYVGGGNDRVDHWLAQLGCDVVALDDADLASDSRLAEFDTLVIGIFAMKFRDALAAEMPRLHQWCRTGGTLVTLYHRPWDNWEAETTAPAKLEVGQPSLRWRVTDETAEVTHLGEHAVLSSPNQITAQDWAGWHKERGLYFAKSWDAAYQPLLEMADPEEQAHRGALLAADIGDGRHIHCALILHHQMEKLVPGAFRLMANLLAKRG